MRKNQRYRLLCLFLAIACFLSACSATDSEGSLFDRLLDSLLPQTAYSKSENSPLDTVVDADSLYEDTLEPKVLYLTVSQGNAANHSNHTWNELHVHDLDWYAETGEEVYRCEATVQFGDEVGPLRGEYGFNASAPNATVRLSGAKASTRQQKNYRIELKNSSGTVAGMKSFVLQKGFTDPFRFTNKLAFTLLRQCSAMLSTRTSFVHLYVRDQTETKETAFMDYGLYTMVEPINKQYLKNRNLDTNGELYKVVSFDFGRHADVIMQPTAPGYSAERFEALLESKCSNDYSGLIEMLDAVNDPSVPIQDVVETYFDKDSLYSWLAFNLLLDNKDTGTENFYLYRPVESKRFYILPWDFDASLRRDYELLRDPAYSPGWKQGIFLYSESVLFRRILESEYCTNELSEYVTALHDTVLSGENVRATAQRMSEVVRKLLYSKADRTYARVTEEDYEALVSRLAEQVDENFYTYYDTLETPWPFHILEPEQTGESVLLRWEASTAMHGSVSYTVELADAWDFEDPILELRDYADTEYRLKSLAPGQYFLRVTAVAESGYTQEAYEAYNTEKNTLIHGVICFYVR